VGKGCAGHANEDDTKRCREATGARKAGEYKKYGQGAQGARDEVEEYGAHLRFIATLNARALGKSVCFSG